jgi:4-diphosphocytidyl-2-C-methyl-D-erythritol kinase
MAEPGVEQTEEAPAKLNLCLYVGERREDGLHEICSLFQPLELADRVAVGPSPAEDEVVCPGVEPPNLAAEAVAALRRGGWVGPPVRVRIEKAIPVGAGLGGGSADAAAVLRLLGRDLDAEGVGAVAAELEIEDLAAGIGADVPSQLRPATALVTGAGEIVETLPDPAPFGVVLVPLGGGLATADVYGEAERIGGLRTAGELDELRQRLAGAAALGSSPLEYAELLVNDLQPAAVSLRPEIAGAVEALRDLRAAAALMSGSGPTAFGLFADVAAAQAAATELRPEHDAIAVAPWRSGP